jgi:hypothetical protein
MKLSKNQNIDFISVIAQKIKPILDQVVFVGGCTVGLMITDEAISEVRETVDVDVIVDVTTRTEHYKMEETLRGLGFQNDQSVICRYTADGYILDVMPTDTKILGFTNQWYAGAVKNPQRIILSDELEILVVTPIYLLATKIEAFLGRGKGDYAISRDMWDIITVIDGRPEIVRDVESSDEKIRAYVSDSFAQFLRDRDFLSLFPGHLEQDETLEKRTEIVFDRMTEIANF